MADVSGRQRNRQTSEFQLEELEPRVLFSADLPMAVLGSVSLDAVTQASVVGEHTQVSTSTNDNIHAGNTALTSVTELVIIDSGVSDVDAMLVDLGLRSNVNQHVMILEDSARDATAALTQLSDVLANFHGLQAVHLISHGGAGELVLGGERVDTVDLLANAAIIDNWRSALAPGADLLVYGCDVASGSSGQAFVETLSLLSGADVAASNNLTGGEQAGGDWTFEVQHGNIQHSVAFSDSLQQDYQASFASYAVTNLNDNGIGSFRFGINQANASGDDYVISFDVSGTILLDSHLPAITDAITIDGGTAAAFDVPLVILDGRNISAAGSGGDGGIQLLAGSDGSVVRGLAIVNFPQHGIDILDSGGHTIESNFVGTDDTNALGNQFMGINLQNSANNVIGGTGKGNVISGNLMSGISISGVNSTGNTIEGNYVGTDSSGLVPMGNGHHGIEFDSVASNNTVGGLLPSGANTIRFNEGAGIALSDRDSANNTHQFNTISDNGGLESELNSEGFILNDSNAVGAIPNDLIATSTKGGGLSINSDGGNDTYVLAEDGVSILGSLNTLSVEIDVALRGGTGSNLFYYDSPGTINDFRILVSSQGRVFAQIDNNVNFFATTADAILVNDGVRRTIALTWDGVTGDLSLYINGKFQQQFTDADNIYTLANDGTLVLGNDQPTHQGGARPALAADIELYQVRVFNEVRTENQLAASYGSELPFNEDGMVAQWTFDNLSSEGVITDSVAGNNLTVGHILQPGFTPSEASLTFELDENVLDGTLVGEVSGIDAERNALIASLLADDPDLKYNAETDKFYKVNDNSFTAAGASASAQSLILNDVNGQLVTIRDAAENNFITHLVASLGGSVWIGATDTAVEGEWRWGESGIEADLFWSGTEDGYAVDGAYNNWHVGSQPNQLGEEDAARLDTTTGRWFDARANDFFHYIAEWNADDVLDTSQALSYAIASQTVAGAFSIDSNRGKITVADGALLDFESNSTHTLSVHTTDVDNNTFEESFLVSLNDQTESTNGPTDISSGIELNMDGGNDSYLRTDNGSAIFGGLTQLTLESRFAITPSNVVYTSLFSYEASGNTNEVRLGILSDGRLSFQIDGQSAIASNSMVGLLDGELHHISLSWDNTNGDVAIYVDGKLFDSLTGIAVGSELTQFPGTLILGQDQTSANFDFSANRAFSSTLYDVRIWDTVRSQADIQLNFQNKFDSSSLPTGLIANWQMDGFNSAGDVVDIVSGNNLSVGHATGTGFIASTPVGELHISESALSQDSVGFVVPTYPPIISNVVSDGQFLEVADPGGAQAIPDGGSIGDWLVSGDGVKLIGSEFESPDGGGRSVSLSDSDGSISQTLTTVAGQQYQVVFEVAGDFSGGDTVKNLRVSASGQSSDITFVEGDNWSLANMGWENRSLTFTATNSTTQISFSTMDINGTSFGPAVGNIRVSEVPQAISVILNNDSTLSYDAATNKFYRFVNTPSHFDVALSAATTSALNGVSGQLVTIDSSHENEIIRQFARDSGNQIWLGASDETTDSEWHWLDGTVESDEIFWVGGRDGGAVNGLYAVSLGLSDNAEEFYLRLGSTGGWFDAPGNINYAYVVEWDASDVLSGSTYSLVDASGNFEISSHSGEITVASSNTLDFETARFHDVDVTVTDAAGNSFVEVLSIAVDNVIDQGFSLPGAQSIDEDLPLEFSSGNMNAVTVTNNSGTSDTQLQVVLLVNDGALMLSQTTELSISEGSNGSSSLTIQGTESALNAALEGMVFTPDENFNGAVTLNVTTSSTSGEEQTSGSVDISVTSVNDAPDDVALADPTGTNLLSNGSFETNSGNANTSTGGTGVTVSQWTPLGGEGLLVWNNFDAGGPGAASEGLANLVLNVQTGINGLAQSVATVANQAYVVSVDFSNINTDPSSEVEVYWRGDLIGTITQSAVAWQTHSFVVTGSGGSDELRFVETENNNSIGSALLDNVRLVAENTPTVTVDENAATGTVVAFAGASDVDTSPVDTRTFTLTEDAGNRFEIDPITGVISVAGGSPLDFEAETSHSISVRVSDLAAEFHEENFVIDVVDVDEAPRDILVLAGSNLISNSSFESNTVGWTLSGAVERTDIDSTPSDGVFSLTFNNQEQANMGLATTAIATEIGKTYTVVFEAGSFGGFRESMSLQFIATGSTVLIDQTVTDIGSNPGTNASYQYTFVADSSTTVISLTDTSVNTINVDINFDNIRAFEVDPTRTMSVAENAASSTFVAQVFSTAQDESETITYSLIDDASGRFSIDATTGEISVANGLLLDHEADSSHDIIVGSTDAGGSLTTSDTFTVNVIDINDALVFSTNVHIENHSFEAQLLNNGQPVGFTTDWTTTGASTGTWNPASSVYSGEAPDGQNVGFIDEVGAFSQTTMALFTPDTDYQLTVAIGDAISPVETNAWQIRLYAGDQLLGAASNDDVNPADDTFTDVSLTLTSAQLAMFSVNYGENLRVEIFDAGTSDNLHFDNVRLTQTSGGITTPTVTYIEDGAAVNLDENLRVFDEELSTVDGFDGVTLNLVRNGGANNDDVFSATGNLLLNAGSLELSSTVVGSYSNTQGELTLSFVAGVSNAQVNEVMQSIAYSNNNDVPPLNVQIDWTFREATTGAQSSGGVEQAVASTMVDIIATNDAATASNLNAAETYTEGTVLDLTDIIVTDVDSATVTASLTLSDVAAGTLNTGTSGSVSSTFVNGVWSASGAIADVNVLLAGVSFTPAANYNSNFTVVTNVDDGVATALTGSKLFTGIAVNDAPTAANNTVATNEDTEYNFAVADFAFSDIDGDSLTSVRITTLETVGTLQLYGTDVILNQVISATDIDAGGLSFVPNLNQSGISYDSFAFLVNDGLSDSMTSYTMMLDVLEVSDAPSLLVISNSTVQENTNTQDGFSIGTLSSSDADTADTFIYSVLSGLDAAVFSIGGVNSNELILTNGVVNFESKSLYSVTIRVTDSAGLTHDQVLEINVINVNEVPVITSQATVNTDENQTSVSTVQSSDVDGGSLTYSISGGIDAELFSINASSGELNFIVAPDHETKDLFQVQVTVTDAGGLTGEQVLSVRVNDVNEAPTILDSEFKITDRFVGVIGQLEATDPDSGEQLVFQLVTESVVSTLDTVVLSDEGELSIRGAHDGTYQFEVKVVDSMGLEDRATLTLRIVAELEVNVVEFIELTPTESEEPNPEPEQLVTPSIAKAEPEPEPESTVSVSSQVDKVQEPQIDGAQTADSDTIAATVNIPVFDPFFETIDDDRNEVGTDVSSELSRSYKVSSRVIVELLTDTQSNDQPDLLGSMMSMFSGSTAPLTFSFDLIDKLDKIRTDAEILEKEDTLKQSLVFASGTVVTATLSVGFATWLIQSGLLVASAMSTTPLWRGMDPMPILMAGSDVDVEGFNASSDSVKNVDSHERTPRVPRN